MRHSQKQIVTDNRNHHVDGPTHLSAFTDLGQQHEAWIFFFLECHLISWHAQHPKGNL